MSNCINAKGCWTKNTSGYCTVASTSGAEVAAEMQNRHVGYLILRWGVPGLITVVAVMNFLINLFDLYRERDFWPSSLGPLIFLAVAAVVYFVIAPRFDPRTAGFPDKQAKVDTIQRYFRLDYGQANNLREQIEAREWKKGEQTIPLWAMKKRHRGAPPLEELLESV